MTRRSAPQREGPPAPTPAGHQSPRRWLLLLHQLPTTPSNLRVRTWRRLQQLGAIAVKQAVYVLPDSPSAREDFEWLKAEIEGAGGQASVFAADSVDAWSDDALVEEFREARQATYADLAREVEQVLRRLDTRRQRTRGRAPAGTRLLEGFRQRFAAIERVDYFGSAGRDRVVTLLEQFEQRLSERVRRPAPTVAAGTAQVSSYRQRLWVTRLRPGVDRMASAWLIRRFIDAEARFGFVPDRASVPRDAVPFDMFDVEFSHRGERCTFETLCEVFRIREGAVTRVAEIVHDLDLKDSRFGAPEASAIGVVIDGLQLLYADDDTLLAQGITLFEALHRGFEQSARRVGPRPVAGPHARSRRSKRTSR